MEMTTNRFRLGRGLRLALADLDHFARELAERNTDEDTHDMSDKSQRRRAIGMQDDPVIPWIKIAIMSLILIAVGIVLQLVQQLTAF